MSLPAVAENGVALCQRLDGFFWMVGLGAVWWVVGVVDLVTGFGFGDGVAAVVDVVVA